MRTSLLDLDPKKGFSNNKSKERRVCIATPSLDGKVDAWYLNSLIETIYLGIKHNVRIFPLIMPGESILPMARNILFDNAYQMDVDCLFYIDSDQKWDPKVFYKILNSNKKVVGLPVCLKNEDNIFNVRFDYDNEKTDGDYFTVNYIGTGFLKIDKSVMKDLYESNEMVKFKLVTLKEIFEYSEIDNEFVSEDFVFCNKIKELGYNIWVDRKNSSHHHGQKMYIGNFEDFEVQVKQFYEKEFKK